MIKDSLFLISKIVIQSLPNDLKLSQIIKRILNLHLIPYSQCYLVLRGNNMQVDEMGNLGTTLPKGELACQVLIQRTPLV